MKTTYRHIALLLLMSLFACSEVVKLKVLEEDGQLIIFGRISNAAEGNYVSVFRTGPLGQPPVPVLGAEVRVYSDLGETMNFTAADSGYYELETESALGRVGQSYHLEVVLGNERYESRAQVIPPNYGRDIMRFELGEQTTISSQGVTINEAVVNVYSETQFDELPEEFYLRWDLEEAYTYLGTFLPVSHFPRSFFQIQCYVINELNEQRIFLHNGKTNRATTIPSRLYVSRHLDKSFQTLHYFNLTRASLNKETHDYWEQLDAVVNRQGSIFDVPPAGVKGNIEAMNSEEEVLGFFEAVSVDITRLAVTRRDIPTFIFDECEKRGDDRLELYTVPRDCRQCLIDEGIVEEYCLVCGVLPGSTIHRPDYF